MDLTPIRLRTHCPMFSREGQYGPHMHLYLDVPAVALSLLVVWVSSLGPEWRSVGISVFLATMVCCGMVANRLEPLRQLRFVFLIAAIFTALMLAASVSVQARLFLELPIMLLAFINQMLALAALAFIPHMRFISRRLTCVVFLPTLMLYYAVYRHH